MEIALVAVALLSMMVAAVLAVLLSRAVGARLAAEAKLAATRQQLEDVLRRTEDFERLRGESLLAAQAAMFTTAQQLSSKLLDDHKRENAATKAEAEARVREASAGLVKQVDEIAKAVHELSGQVKDKGAALDTLWRAVSSPAGGGQLAEIGLANTLKSFGLEQGRDFLLQHTTEAEESGRRLRPDAVVFLPANSALVIDCKASKFVLDIARAEGTADAEAAYANLARSMNQHLRALAEKDYRNAVLAAWRQSGREEAVARIFSVMYVPNEAVLEKLHRADPEFTRKAREREITPAGPAGLHCMISIASVEINMLRRIENQEHIVELTQSLLDSLAVCLGHAALVGRSLKSTAEAFARFAASVNQRLLPRSRRLTQLGVQPGKPLPANIATYAVQSSEESLLDGEPSPLTGHESPPLPRLVR